MIEGENLEYLDILTYPNIKIQENKVTMIQGESGSGKSTLLKLLNQTVSPTKGSIFYRGIPIEEIDTITLRNEMILTNQNLFLFKGTIRDNFNLYYEKKEIKIISDVEIKRFLKICQLNVSLDALCDTMSGGEKQRVFHAIALSFQPRVLMLDEPTSALDQNTAHAFLRDLTTYCKEHNITLLMISHDTVIVEKYGDCFLNLEKAVK